ncbi:MAG: hypothetical protein ABI624_08630 [Casimicrobiaceae bacterium]
MHALLIAAVISFAFAAANALAQGVIQPKKCEGACGVIQSIAAVNERQEWTPLGSVTPGSQGLAGLGEMSGSSTQMAFGPGFSRQGMVVLGAAGGATYGQRPNEYSRKRWDVTVKMDTGMTRVVSLKYEPLLVQEGDHVRISGNSLELVDP